MGDRRVSTFLFVIACIIWFLAAAAMVMALLGLVFGIGDGNWALGEGIIAFVAWLAGAALLICIPIWTGVFTGGLFVRDDQADFAIRYSPG